MCVSSGEVLSIGPVNCDVCLLSSDNKLCVGSSPCVLGCTVCAFLWVKCCPSDHLIVMLICCQETIYWLCANSSPCVLEVLCAFLGEVLSIGTFVVTVDHCVWFVEENGAKCSRLD